VETRIKMPKLQRLEKETGKIVRIVNYGSIVQIDLEINPFRTVPVYFDHRMFETFYEANAPLANKIFEYNDSDKTIMEAE